MKPTDPHFRDAVERICARKCEYRIEVGLTAVSVQLSSRTDPDYAVASPRATVYGRRRNGVWKATVGADHASYYTMTPELSELILIGKRIAAVMEVME
jgi:hypothetical protein